MRYLMPVCVPLVAAAQKQQSGDFLVGESDGHRGVGLFQKIHRFEVFDA